MPKYRKYVINRKNILDASTIILAKTGEYSYSTRRYSEVLDYTRKY